LSLLLAVLLLAGAQDLVAATKRPAPKPKAPKIETPRPRGSEVLTYSVEILNQRAGHVRSEIVKDKRGRVVTLLAEASTVGSIGKAFPVKNRQVAQMKKGKPWPKSSLQEREDQWAKRVTKVSYGKRPEQPSTIDHRFTTKKRRVSYKRPLPTHVQDLLSAFFFLSTRKIEAGKSWSFPVHSGAKLYVVRAKAVSVEDVWTADSQIRKAWKLDLEVIREPVWRARGDGQVDVVAENKDGWKQKMNLWVSSDAASIPIKLTYSFKLIGNVTVTLRSHTVNTGPPKPAKPGKAGKKRMAKK
jgi:hypothetical protein